MNTFIKKYVLLALCATSFMSCQKGLVFEEIPEIVYNEVGLKGTFGIVSARELFKQNIAQVNFNNQLTDMVLTVDIAKAFANETKYTNTTTENVEILGQTVAPGSSINLKNNLSIVDDASAPEGKRYVVTFFVDKSVRYTTPNKGHLFIESTFANAAVKPILIDPIEPGKSQTIQLPVNTKQLVVGLSLTDDRACKVTSVDGAPQLGIPGDFSEPRLYLVTNVNERPNGQGKRARLYEIKVQVLQ